jgi:hypothetical protein
MIVAWSIGVPVAALTSVPLSVSGRSVASSVVWRSSGCDSSA